MGRFSKTTQIKNNTDRAGFISAFNDVMAKRGFVPCSEDEAAKSYLLAFSDGWVTFTSESEDVPQVVKDMNVTSFSVEVVDSDFAILTLNNGDTVIFGDGSGYGIEDSPKGERKFWEPLLADGKTWEQFCKVRDKNEVFVEDALCEAAPILGIDTKYIIADYNELLDMAEDDRNVGMLYFKEKAADKKSKPMTLNAAFVKVFGEALEPLGFKKIKSRYPYFVRVVPGGEIFHIIALDSDVKCCLMYDGIKYRAYNIKCGIATIYRNKIDLSQKPNDFTLLKSLFDIYTEIHPFDLDLKYRSSIMEFDYNPTKQSAIIDSLKKSFEVTQSVALPILDEVTSLEHCVDCFAELKYPCFPNVTMSNEGLLCTKLFNSDEYRKFIKRFHESAAKAFEYELRNDIGRFTEEEIVKKLMVFEERNAEWERTCCGQFDDSKLQANAPAELEHRKEANRDRLREYGLDL